MKFIVSSAVLLKHVQLISGVVVSHTVLPILENFLFSIEDKNLIITASDIETTMSIQIPVESMDNFSFCIPSKLLIETLKNLPEQPLTISIDENFLIEITSERGKYKLMGADPLDFPQKSEITENNTIVLESNKLTEAIQYNLFCVGNDDNRPAMTGIHMELMEDHINFVSTDAQRLVLFTQKNLQLNGQTTKFTVPKKPMQHLKNILAPINEEIKLNFSENHLYIETTLFTMITRLIDAPFPEYRVVIPKDNPFKLEINKNDFTQAIKRVMVFSNKSNNLISLAISSNSLIVETEDSDFNNEGHEIVECTYFGNDIKIGFNAKLFLECVQAVQNDIVSVELVSPKKGVIIKPLEKNENEELIILSMPLSLDYNNE